MAYAEEKETGKPEDDQKLIEADRKYLAELIDAEDVERNKMRDDMRFCTLDQWDKEIRNDREGDIENGPRPCLTIDKINQYTGQVENDLRQGKPGINVKPQDDKSDVELARIIKGIVRNIEDQSNADIAYATAAGNTVKIGLGYFRITAEYVDEDSSEQELRIRPIPNTFSVYLGPHILPDGSDAECGYIIEAMPIAKFKEEFPDAKCEKKDFDSVDAKIMGHWRTDETITVVEKYELEKKNGTTYFLADGTSISREDYEKWPESEGVPPTVTGQRTTTKKQLKWRKMTAVEVLDRRDLPGKWIPIVEMVGKESWVDGKRIVWGLVRPAKDSLRMYNYWASTITEKMGLAPKNPFIVAAGQLEGLEDKWKAANKKNYAYLEYKNVDSQSGNSLPAPQRQGATPMEAAYFHFMEVIEHDVQASLGMFQAAVGETESQQSGRALMALQRQSSTGTYHFGANQGVSIRHGGRIIVDLIPHYYDTKRIIRIMGDDGEVETVEIDPDQQEPVKEIQTDLEGIKKVYNPTIGRYDVSIMAGPSYATKRMEDQAVFVEMAKGAADPASAAILRYLVMRNSDNPGSQEAAKLLKAMLPPQALQALESKKPIPPEAMAEMQKMRGAMAQMQEGMQKLQQENMQLKAGAETTAMKIKSEAMADRAKLMMSAKQAEDDRQRERERMAEERMARIQKANDDKSIAIFEARLKAATAVEVAQINAKGALMETAINAENDANIALSEALQPDGDMEVAEPTKPPIMQMADMHREGMASNAEGMNKLGELLAQLTAATAALAQQAAKPKTINARSSSGSTITATVQ